MKKPKFQAPTGMHDILPEDQKYFQKISDICQKMADFYGFQKIETPILEQAELFSKGIGLATDLIQKQMFTFRTRGGDFLALRPEGTASVVRAYIEKGMANLPQPVKLWYFGPFFRYEKPQAGRFRQFWQFGFEVLGEKNPVIDTQIIQIFFNIFKELKFKNLIVEINNIGDSQCRPYYKKLLTSFFRSREISLCADCRRRMRENPLRILDCKQEKCQRIVSQAPQIIDHLCEECKEHFKEVLEFLDELELPYRLNPYLVRGLDYYTKTVFEFVDQTPSFSPSLPPGASPVMEPAKKLELAGGGRYDNLIKILGGKDGPACGCAAGIERIVEALKQKGLKFLSPLAPKIFLAQLGTLSKRKSLKIFEEFRQAKIPLAESFGKDSLKTQLTRANRMGVDFVLIFGQKEALEDKIIVRDMKTGKQEIIKLEKVVEKMRKKLRK